MDALTQNEKEVIRFLREARPFEKVTIQKDAQGRQDFFIITREQKIFLVVN